MKEQLSQKIQKLNALAQSRNEKLATMALRWLLQKEGVTSVIIGASKKEQILEDLEALQPQPFSKDELDARCAKYVSVSKNEERGL